MSTQLPEPFRAEHGEQVRFVERGGAIAQNAATRIRDSGNNAERAYLEKPPAIEDFVSLAPPSQIPALAPVRKYVRIGHAATLRGSH